MLKVIVSQINGFPIFHTMYNVYLLINIVLKVIVSQIKFILRFYINGNGNIQWLNFDSKFASPTLSVHPVPLIMGDG